MSKKSLFHRRQRCGGGEPLLAGKGAWITIEVEDVRAEYQRIAALGVPIEVDLRDEP